MARKLVVVIADTFSERTAILARRQGHGDDCQRRLKMVLDSMVRVLGDSTTQTHHARLSASTNARDPVQSRLRPTGDETGTNRVAQLNLLKNDLAKSQ